MIRTNSDLAARIANAKMEHGAPDAQDWCDKVVSHGHGFNCPECDVIVSNDNDSDFCPNCMAILD